MKKFIISSFLISMSYIVFAQQDAQFTQYMFNKLSVNPGSAGHNGGICATVLNRNQWSGFDGHPQTTLFSADARFSKHGVGLTVFSDKLGIEESFVAKLAYAYHLQLGPGELGIGLEAGLLSKSFTNNFIAINDPTLDPSIPNANAHNMTFDAGFGLYYSIANKMYIGISSLHIPQSSVKKVANGSSGIGALNYQEARHYYIIAGYDWDINKDKKWILKPSILAKTDAASTQLDANLMLLYNNLVWGGVSYRVQDAVAALVGVSYKGFKIGVSYDFTTSTLNKYSNGSLELMLKYCTSINKPPHREVYHSVRFL